MLRLRSQTPVTPPAICPTCRCRAPTTVEGGRVYFVRHLNFEGVRCSRPVDLVPEPDSAGGEQLTLGDGR